MRKKNIIMIALIAIFLIGSVALNAVDYDIRVHINGPADGFYQCPMHSGNQSISFSSGGTYDIVVSGGYPTNFYIEATGRIVPYITDSDAIGLLNPNEINHVYLDVIGVEPKPDPEPYPE